MTTLGTLVVPGVHLHDIDIEDILATIPPVYDTEGKFIFEVDPGFSNITLEQLNRMVLCFNACIGIPGGALESAVEAGNNIWVSGYTAGIKQYAEQQE